MQVVKLTICNYVPGHWVDVWRNGVFPEKLQVSECATDHKHRLWNDWALDIRQVATFLGLGLGLGFRKPLYNCIDGMWFSRYWLWGGYGTASMQLKRLVYYLNSRAYD